jgi:cyanophycinase
MDKTPNKIFLHGGGDSPEARSAAFGRFVQAFQSNPGGPLLIVAADPDPDAARETADFYRTVFAELSVPINWLVPLLVSAEEPLTGAQVAGYAPSGIFVCGGRVPYVHQALCSDLSWVEYKRENAIPYGATGAGSVIAASRAIMGGWQTDGDVEPRPIVQEVAGEGLDTLTVKPGADLVPFAVETHTGKTGSLTRLIHAVSQGLVSEGWALSEDTLLAFHPTRIHLFGRGHAYRVVRAAEGRATVRVFTAPADYRRR